MAVAQKAVGGRLAAESLQSVHACVWTGGRKKKKKMKEQLAASCNLT